MSIFVIIPFVVFALCLGVLAFFAIRYFPQLRILNIDSSEEERTRIMKEEMILRRFSRRGGKPVVILVQLIRNGFTQLRRYGRRTVHRLRDLEAQYRTEELQAQGVQLTPDQLQKMVEEANRLVREEKLSQAEKKFIEIVSLAPKFAEAYEYLGRLYVRMKEYTQAIETLKFALKIDSDDPSILASLGEAYAADGRSAKALEYFEQAVERRPGNPKYLDGMIESAILARRLTASEQALKMLKDVNPENQKIKDFEERIEALRG